MKRFTYLFIYFPFLFKICTWGQSTNECSQKFFGYGSYVCVCSESNCDSLRSVNSLSNGTGLLITSNKKNKRWHFQEIDENRKLESSIEMDVTIDVFENRSYQTILGFGGAFTDAAGINIMNLSENLQTQLLKSYYGKNGLEYTVGRVPIGGTDFSVRPYTYDDLTQGEIDPSVQKFALSQEDYVYKIPLIKRAMLLVEKAGIKMKLIGSPWSGPSWMKSNGKINGNGELLRQFYGSWATYIIKFLRSYEKSGIRFYGITTQNEPTAGLNFQYPFNQMAWTPEKQALWISEYLGPQLHDAGFESVKVFALDDQRFLLPLWMKILMNSNASKYVDGIGVHWYYDFMTPASNLDLTHKYFPQLPILYTEACTGYAPWNLRKVILGSWERAESYAKNIIENLLHWSVGWIDWNLALNEGGGPNWAKNYVDSPIIVPKDGNQFYMQPMYYALAHFSKVIPEGSVRINHKANGKYKNDLEVVSFKRPDTSIALIILNRCEYSIRAKINIGKKLFEIIIESRSINTFIWKHKYISA